MLTFNREGDLLLSSSRDTNCSACCWHARDGHMQGSFTTVTPDSKRLHDPANTAIDVNNYSTIAATASSGEEAMLWSVETGALLGTINRPMSSGSAVNFSHDDRMLMVATKGRSSTRSAINVYNVPIAVPPRGEAPAPAKTDFNPTITHEADSGEFITWAAWGPTNTTIYFSEGGFMNLLDVETGRLVHRKEIHEQGPINRFRFSRDYLTLATAGEDCTAHLLDHRDFSTIQVYESDVPVNDVSISPTADHVILGGGMDASAVTTQGGSSVFEVKFFHKVYGTPLGHLSHLHFGTITSLSFTPDGKGFASGSFDGIIKLCRFGENYHSATGAVPLWSLSSYNAAHNLSDDE
ncbi:translation initiation factor 3 subunit I [Strigomonas culicis]|nr:translation initiation factor 3 subunit I [Strigomonas culicis]|eukprot:EPY35532.1 translation initiation factor 3 subunit I [Strigomonas culicis]